MTRLAVLFVTLMLTVPAHALDYTGIASIDWSSLTFSAPVTLEPDRIEMNAASIAGGDTNISEWQGAGSMDFNIAGLGHVFTTSDSAQILASVNLISDGFGQAQMLREGFFVVGQTGDLTISLNYNLSHLGIPPADFTASAFADLGLGTQDQQVVLASNSDGQTGTLSLTQFFTVGDQGVFSASVGVQGAGSGGSVPIPHLYWPSLVSMVGLVMLGAWRQQRDFFNRCWPLGMLVFLLPQWTALESALQDITTWMIQGGLTFVQIPYVLDGPHRVLLSSGLWTIDPDCAGLRYLVPGLALAYLFAAWRYARVTQRLAFLVGCAVVLILANGLRAFGVIAGSEWGLTVGADHRVFSYAVFGLALLGLAWMAKRRTHDHQNL